MKLLKKISITAVFMICTANTVFAKEIKAPDVRALGAVLMDEADVFCGRKTVKSLCQMPARLK